MGRCRTDEAAMTIVKARIHVAADGTLTGRAAGIPAGDHDAEIVLMDRGEAECDPDRLAVRVRAIQAEVARLPVLDARSPDEIIGYNTRGHVD
jgi:hypothetical protein